ncbi:MAG: elongation factor P [Bacteroidetes bacterium]|nr:elongation factor P [Bacteroidota bacterium]MBU1422715.1 elongation factor P [Bacteroidota bacterium]MBU2470905.1 elongation factor P [Bacteroidota bacterium]MBU2635505.1 elongation factor P [Bacteroidota bacterium]
MPSTSDFRNGLTIKMDGDLWTIVEFQHVNPGNWRAFVRAKLKNLKSGKVIETRFRAGESIETVRIDRKQYQFLYHDGSGYICMDSETYDQITVDEKHVGDGGKFLKDSENIEIIFNGNEVIGVELPITVELKIVETGPGIKGDTATGGTKPAKVESGAIVNVPLFLNEGDTIKVDTRTGQYLERVKTS